MAKTYVKKSHKQNNVLYAIVTAVLICIVFLTMVNFFYEKDQRDAYDMLHLQTKQIKDDIVLQMESDKENLVTMANFAAKLYARGESYNLMFDSFKPIGLFSRIGILTPDEVFITKDETVDLKGKLSFDSEVEKGEHITGRTYSYSRPDEQVVRTAVPIRVNGETVGLIYGIIKIETINEKYNNMAKELNAQLFVYDKDRGRFIIDTIDKNPGELSAFKNREYNENYSYEQLLNNNSGFISFKSKLTGEDLYAHYSTIEAFNWGIMLARYDTQVFEKTREITQYLLVSFALVVLIIIIYLRIVMKREKAVTKLQVESSNIRKLLLEIAEQYANITEATKRIKEFTGSRSAFFADTDGEDFYYIDENVKQFGLFGSDRKYFHGEIFTYAANIHNDSKSAISFMRIMPDKHLENTNRGLYDFLKKHDIKDVSVVIVPDRNNHVGVLGAINSKKSSITQKLLEDVAVCFSIAAYNKKHLNKTEIAATTDSLTGAMNRVSYKKDILVFDKEKPEDFVCIYIDVNELHLRNNKYGHAAGDEMLIYIANTLKEVFYGHKIYRMGGDEFLVFAEGVRQDDIKNHIKIFLEQLKPMGYNVALGISYRSQNTNCEEMVREAEVRMYEAKAQYYQGKKRVIADENKDKGYVYTKTGIKEIDTMISVLNEHYNGIYRVSLENDDAHRILMPAYLGYNENEEHFSKLLAKYIDENVHPEFHRAVMNFLNYNAIKRQLLDGKIPSITYKKTFGETVELSVYSMDDDQSDVKDTLWVFAKI